ncbi:8-oxoguanine glycosylase ogg1 [Lunasporangiospora selenospora]|uniref:N-glycosylase/DNA lyase n=1 Tax=Lunasporangiospora selenospora TaxID=979761 RepID=A0A9P6G0N7_9FUNG|nr:8-oxoguanine glycosylase ogg1 [Lunasporangiospora selenospora]
MSIKSTLPLARQICSSPWTTIKVPRSELDLSTTLKCGQSFRWQRRQSSPESSPVWSCVLDQRLWYLQETLDGLQFKTYRTLPAAELDQIGSKGGNLVTKKSQDTPLDDAQQDVDRDIAFLRDYFQLQVPLTELYEKWSQQDRNFKTKAANFPGVRILRQDPVENLFCFICSSNNNISRISQMVMNLCREYGTQISIPEESGNTSDEIYYGFPTVSALAQDGVEETLRRLGFGYRAKYISSSAKYIEAMENGDEWLHGLRKLPYESAHEALLALSGVGPKVADCICLMSLDKSEAIPVDTHVWQIAIRDYKFRFEGKVPKTMSSGVYKAVSKHFVDLFGEYSGWAHSVLFAADLRVIEGRTVPESSSTIVSVVKEENVELLVPIKSEDVNADSGTKPAGRRSREQKRRPANEKNLIKVQTGDPTPQGPIDTTEENGFRRSKRLRTKTEGV